MSSNNDRTFGSVSYMNENVVLTLARDEALDLASIMWSCASESSHPEAPEMLNTAALMFREPRPHGQPSYYTARLENLEPPAPLCARAIRAEISRLEAALVVLSGEPLDLEYHDLPEGGAILEYSPAISEYGFRHWYPDLEAAKAALLKMARDAGTTPDPDGLHADMSPPASQYSTRAWITRR